MIARAIGQYIKKAARHMPIVGIVGPRQSGKTTLAKQLFPSYLYVNLEQLDLRRFAIHDPRGFLQQYDRYVIFDEIQRTPELFSYLQAKTDQDNIKGQYILTGSQHFLMLSSISQSLSGRIALFTLYPLSYQELLSAGISKKNYREQLWCGGYPRIYDQHISPVLWLNNYIQTYLDRDISLISQITNLPYFEKFLHLLAGRTGQLLNLSSLGNDVGVTHNTVKAWVNLLEVSGIIYILPPYFANLGKRLTKSPKLYFVDTGLACRLLGIESSAQLTTHPLLGSLFETYIVTEMLKKQLNQGLPPAFFFWRDKNGLEADICIETSNHIELYEIKSSATVPADAFNSLKQIKTYFKKNTILTLIYGGDEPQKRSDSQVIPWSSI